MIDRIQIEVLEPFSKNEYILIDFVQKSISYFKDDTKIETSSFDYDKLNEHISNSIIYWKNEYTDSVIIDGTIVKIEVSVKDEILTYQFRNQFPDNYKFFIDKIRKMVVSDDI